MLLAIDAGNTNVVFAVFDGGDLRDQWRAATDKTRTADEYAVWLTQLMAVSGLKAQDITGAIIASVVPAARQSLVSLCQRYFHVEPLEIGAAGVDLGIEVAIDRPQDVGADRLANARAAHERYGGPLIIVDFGTGTVFDAIDADGSYLGGAISPGIGIAADALFERASRLPEKKLVVWAREGYLPVRRLNRVGLHTGFAA
jgi:type III pantothenate kinase